MIVACIFLSVSLLDTTHIFSYKGMPAFLMSASPDKAIILLMASRLEMSIGMLVASIIPDNKNIKANQSLHAFIFSLLTIGFIIVVNYKPDIFPLLFIEGEGLTPLKVGMEYFVSAILMITAFFSYRHYSRSKPNKAYFLLVVGFVVGGLGQLSFTRCNSLYGIYNVLGRFYIFISYYLFFRGLFVIHIKNHTKTYMKPRRSLVTMSMVLKNL